MAMKVICCVCKAVLKEGDEERVSHGYCRTCAARQKAQFVIWDAMGEEENHGIRHAQ